MDRYAQPLVTLVVGLSLMFVTIACGYTPQSSPPAKSHRSCLNSELPATELTGITMASPRSGWAMTSAPVRVLKTSSGGARWVDVSPPHVRIPGLAFQLATSFPSPTTAVLAMKGRAGEQIRIYRTADAGTRWTASLLHLPAPIASAMEGGAIQVQFVDATRGWLLLTSQGFAGHVLDALYGTEDGGGHWRLLQSSVPGSRDASGFEDVTAMAFSSPASGTAAINTVVYNTAEVLVTHNGGRRWTTVTLPLPGTTMDTEAVEGAPSASAQGTVTIPVTIALTSTTQQLLLYTTTDGGLTWQGYAWPKALPIEPGSDVPTESPGQNFLMAGGQRLFLTKTRYTDEYGLSITAQGSPTWRRLARLPTLVSSATILSSGPEWAVGSSALYHRVGPGSGWKVVPTRLVSCSSS